MAKGNSPAEHAPSASIHASTGSQATTAPRVPTIEELEDGHFTPKPDPEFARALAEKTLELAKLTGSAALAATQPTDDKMIYAGATGTLTPETAAKIIDLSKIA